MKVRFSVEKIIFAGMDNVNDYYLERLDLSVLTDFIRENGTLKELGKHEYLARQGDFFMQVGYIEEGMFRYLRTDTAGNEHVVGYSFVHTLVGEYSSCLCHRPVLTDIQAIGKCKVRLVAYEKLRMFWEASPEHQRLGRLVAEQLFAMAYHRLVDYCCSTPEERYLDLMDRYPDLKEQRPLKEIASFIGVTPETVSAIRRKLLKKGKS